MHSLDTRPQCIEAILRDTWHTINAGLRIVHYMITVRDVLPIRIAVQGGEISTTALSGNMKGMSDQLTLV